MLGDVKNTKKEPGWGEPLGLMETDEKGLLEKLPIVQWHFFCDVYCSTE